MKIDKTSQISMLSEQNSNNTRRLYGLLISESKII